MNGRWPVRDRGGFVMVMVVFLLFAVAVAGATGYQIVAAEAQLASGAGEAQKALAAARAGLQRYVGEHLGVPGDTVTYVIADADVTVTTRKLVSYTSPITPDVYMIEAVGELADPRYPESPARRTVRQYARLQKQPVNVLGAVMNPSNTIAIGSRGTVRGEDQAASGARGSALSAAGACSGTIVLNAYGAVARTTGGTTGGTLSGSPNQRLGVTSIQNVIDTARVRWSALQDPDFPIPYDGTWPNFGADPDSFYVVRHDGNLSAGSSHSGRGVLIVTGQFSFTTFSAFAWDGIILAGSSPNTLTAGWLGADIDGALITGLDGANQTTLTVGGSGFFAGDLDVQNQSCYTQLANRSLAYFELIDGSRWEF